ncbi:MULTISPECIES: tubby C-terminal domain-like protein [Mammaliicoccus]|uniref:Tubby C-terminal domain-containing protein n=1 Tax=Mammaliicoccus fleurettii TaxID=150056 RepID=A0ABS5ML15_9STAP|nr:MULTISPECIES: hypothetical protein [Mammaliicoccus]HCN61054.1 hypothetical protein [Staphylococcus sp.]MBL0846365.1 hypothetical protein [Mammaliicoccus fleurettii]MBS3671441.1 hypothetical protein [Mammaliicoccus fleurettii]MBS3696605.1 hypothetical protein [Mammaliicoccus fleurettii]MBW0766105.1 hypothetical protein [Mammaliicoccus fleurettii]
MTHFHFKENFWGASTKPIEIYDEQNNPAFVLSLYYTSSRQETFALLGRKKHNFKIEFDGGSYKVLQERSLEGKFKTPFKNVWEVFKNDTKIGTFETRFGFKPKIIFNGTKNDSLIFESGFISRSVKVTDQDGKDVMETKSERFKVASNHGINVISNQYHPAMLIMLFQVFFEYQEYQRSKSN